MTTLAEELVLLAFDDQTGRNRVNYLDYGLVGAVLLDLTLAQRIDLSGRHVVVHDSRPTGEPVHDEILQRIQQSRPRKPAVWVQKLRKGLRNRVLDKLVAASVLRHQKDTVMGLFPMNRYFVVIDTLKTDARNRLSHAVDTGAKPNEPTAALAGLVNALKMERHALPGRKTRDTRKALAAIAEKSWASEAIKKAIAATQSAVTASTGAAALGGGS